MTVRRTLNSHRARVVARLIARRGFFHPRWRNALAIGVLLGVVTAPLPGGQTVGDVVTDLGQEWTACALDGRPATPVWQRADTTPVTAMDLESHEPTVDGVPVIVPRQHVPTAEPASDPQPDRPDTHPRTVRVAVIDSGVQADHPDVAAVRPGLDLLNPCGDGRQDVTGHGTMVAGVMSSVTYGASPRIDVLPVRVSTGEGRHLPWLSAAAVIYATNNGADIINMSYANQARGPSHVERAALRYARNRGVALVAAAGNDPSKPAGYPAAYLDTLSVTSVDPDGQLSLFAAHEGAVDVAAPGSRVLTLWPDGSVRVASGTSLAAPVVSASIAQLLLTDPSLSGAQAVELLRGSTGAPQYPSFEPSFGALDIAGALTSLCQAIGGCHDDEPDTAGGAGSPPLQPR